MVGKSGLKASWVYGRLLGLPGLLQEVRTACDVRASCQDRPCVPSPLVFSRLTAPYACLLFFASLACAHRHQFLRPIGLDQGLSATACDCCHSCLQASS